MTKIALCAPAAPITPEDVARAESMATVLGLRLVVHPQCFEVAGHFAGTDARRLEAFLDCANDPGVDALWFARGGYGSNRIAAAAVAGLGADAARKTYLGYSDMGYLLGALYRAGVGQAGVGRVAHGPMLADGRRAGGERALARALGFLAGSTAGLEPSLGQHHLDRQPMVAFNLMTLAMLCGTDLMPDLTGHVVMIEEVAEHLYAVDRLFFHLTQHLRGVAGIKLGRVSDVPDNDRPFGASAQDIAKDWCQRSGIPFLGTADIGHDADNKIVPFGV